MLCDKSDEYHEYQINQNMNLITLDQIWWYSTFVIDEPLMYKYFNMLAPSNILKSTRCTFVLAISWLQKNLEKWLCTFSIRLQKKQCFIDKKNLKAPKMKWVSNK